MHDESLSPAGVARREQILVLAQGVARRRRRRRMVIRGGEVLLLLAAVGSLFLLRVPGEQPGGNKVAEKPTSPVPGIAPVSQPVVAVQYLETDSTITDRLMIPPTPPTWKPIDDHELLSELAAAGQPAGIVTVHGKTMLMMR